MGATIAHPRSQPKTMNTNERLNVCLVQHGTSYDPTKILPNTLLIFKVDRQRIINSTSTDPECHNFAATSNCAVFHTQFDEL